MGPNLWMSEKVFFMFVTNLGKQYLVLLHPSPRDIFLLRMKHWHISERVVTVPVGVRRVTALPFNTATENLEIH